MIEEKKESSKKDFTEKKKGSYSEFFKNIDKLKKSFDKERIQENPLPEIWY